MKENSDCLSPDQPGQIAVSDRPTSTPSGQKTISGKPNTFEQVRDRKTAATVSVLSGGDNAVSEVLEKARAIADATLADQKDETAHEIAAELVAQETQELNDLRNFFKRYRTGETARLIAPYQNYLDGEIVE
ncbi:hypothetical protein LEP3755_66140 (plasmid) [Leptolyngbya sp. NIES-3755]|nr:hypothetical protein LEP3755_66140 [Leptolyngbya sp. NIES-3755]